MEYFEIKNFEKFQHYKKRNPPWVRLYHSIMDDLEFAQLPDCTKAHLVQLWALAPRYNNRLPMDADFIAQRINATHPVDLNLLLEKGFIKRPKRKRNASNTLAGCKQNATPEVQKYRSTEVTDNTEEQKDINGGWGIPFEDLSLARTMREEIFKICPDTAGPEVEQSWATEIQKMRRVKKLTTEQIVQTWDWARNDEFYCKIVSGPAELFRHWDKIRFKMVQKPKQSENRYEKARNQSAGFAERYKNGELRIGQNQLHGFGGEIPQRTGDFGPETS